ncbi:Hypothetical protein FKW44_023947 [Caligus rogercresseyi]|uniref:Uncharacterized protein n=1 Tax=Caligus rogercresseyi TaxID=217165 RepID=A0A7T8GQK2_CALRO|nr:Hypothetical protein FKW44_023947 [Caligus rogercresseyi]
MDSSFKPQQPEFGFLPVGVQLEPKSNNSPTRTNSSALAMAFSGRRNTRDPISTRNTAIGNTRSHNKDCKLDPLFLSLSSFLLLYDWLALPSEGKKKKRKGIGSRTYLHVVICVIRGDSSLFKKSLI